VRGSTLPEIGPSLKGSPMKRNGSASSLLLSPSRRLKSLSRLKTRSPIRRKVLGIAHGVLLIRGTAWGITNEVSPFRSANEVLHLLCTRDDSLYQRICFAAV
jgi:hypothetical protein